LARTVKKDEFWVVFEQKKGAVTTGLLLESYFKVAYKNVDY